MTPTLILPSSLDIGNGIALAADRDEVLARTVFDTRSTVNTGNSEDNEGLQKSTGLLIAGGLVCFLVLLIGFWLVARPRVEPARASAPNQPAPRTRRGPDMSERLGVWKVWKHTTLSTSTSANRGSRRITHVPPTLAAHRMRPHLSIPPLLRTTGSAIPNLATDPQSQNVRPAFEDRRATMFASAAPSLVSSDVTEETLSNFRAGAYELDYDLELGMMKYAQDDASQQQAVELGRGSVEGIVNNGSVTSGLDHVAAQKEGDDSDGVESSPAPRTTVGSAASGSEVDIKEVDKVAMGRQALQ